MIQFFDEEGRAHAATVVEAGPITVTGVRMPEADGYAGVQVGYGTKSEKNIAKAQKGAWKDLGMFEDMREFRLETALDGVKTGDSFKIADIFTVGDPITVTGISKGKGFQGVVKRHGFHGDKRSHGRKHGERSPGAIGSGGIQRVFKGMRMAGRMGSDRVTVKNLTVLAIHPETHTMLIKGAVPGRRGTILEITSQK